MKFSEFYGVLGVFSVMGLSFLESRRLYMEEERRYGVVGVVSCLDLGTV